MQVAVVVIGVSTGGPNALAEICFRALPADFPVPILIVQHMPPMFTRLLAERLTAANSKVPVEELLTGRSWFGPRGRLIAPGDFLHMTLARDGLQVRVILESRTARELLPARGRTRLLRSAAKVYGSGVLAVVLTGMGCRTDFCGSEVVRAGGRAGHRAGRGDECGLGNARLRRPQAGLADKVLPLSLVSNEIVRRVRAGGARS